MKIICTFPDKRQQEEGSGVVIGDDGKVIHIVTAAHVLTDSQGTSLPGTVIEATNFQTKENAKSTCTVSIIAEKADDPDIAILNCERPAGFTPSYDVLGRASELRQGARLILIRNLDNNLAIAMDDFVYSPPNYSQNAPRNAHAPLVGITFADIFNRDIKGSSGGGIFTDRSELIGIVIRQDPGQDFDYGLAWSYVQDWIEKKLGKSKIKLHIRSPSAPTLRPGNVEVSAEVATMFVPQFGWLNPGPKLRIATTLPNVSLVDVAFDFTFSQTTKTIGSGSEDLSLIVPAITGEFALGSIRFLRRQQWLGGLYLGGGVAPVFLQDTLRSYNVQSANVHAWTPVLDAGWRYRMKGRQWGFSASYREGILLGNEAQSLYPRFRSFSSGMFVLFH